MAKERKMTHTGTPGFNRQHVKFGGKEELSPFYPSSVILVTERTELCLAVIAGRPDLPSLTGIQIAEVQ